MQVSEAVKSRKSSRAFLSTPVDKAVLLEVLEKAQRAPSNSNIQPWRVHLVLGDVLAELRRETAERSVFPPVFDAPHYPIYPDPLDDPYAARRFECGERQYGTRGIDREDHQGRLEYVYGNMQFFGAPAGLFIFTEKGMGPSQWADLGIYLQTVLLLLTERGLDSCAQISWALFNGTIQKILNIDADMELYCGVAIGLADPDDSINRIEASRADLGEVVTVHGG